MEASYMEYVKAIVLKVDPIETMIIDEVNRSSIQELSQAVRRYRLNNHLILYLHICNDHIHTLSPGD